MLEAEHGGASPGPCIDHTHVHVIPGLGSAIDLLQSADLQPQSGEPGYIWLRAGNVERLYLGTGVRGQFLRRSIAGWKGIEDWDWAVAPKLTDVQATISFWNLNETRS